MGKRKRGMTSKDNAIGFFIRVMEHLITLHEGREKFALSWIWNDEKALHLFVESVLGLRKGGKDLLFNGYRNCRCEEHDAFSEQTWVKIDELFLNKRLFSHLPKPMQDLVKMMKSASLIELRMLVGQKEKEIGLDTSSSQTWEKVTKMSKNSLEEMFDCFVGEWRTKPSQLFQSSLAKMCRPYPQECVVARFEGDLTYFYEKQGDDVVVIAVHLKKALEHRGMMYMRSLMEDLYAGHPQIIRKSMAILHSHMTGFGPFWQRFQYLGGKKVLFYTHVEKLSTVLRNLPVAEEFQMLVDRYAHTHLSELIFALFLWKLPMLVGTFLDYGHPYLGSKDYDMTALESHLGGRGPCAYQLFITKDFCSQVHRDLDTSRFTLGYCSHPDAGSTIAVDFVMAEHGFRIPLENGSMLGFNSSVAHGTGYRNPTTNAAYMAVLVINSALNALTKRRQLL